MMRTPVRQIRVRVDGCTRFTLMALTALMAVMVLGLWATVIPAPTPASAQEKLFDTSAQRLEQIKVQKETNDKLQQILDYLKSGQLKVQIQEPADPRKAGPVHVVPKP